MAFEQVLILKMALRRLEEEVYCFFACYSQRTATRQNLAGRRYWSADRVLAL